MVVTFEPIISHSSIFTATSPSLLPSSLQVFAIEFGDFAIEFVPFAIEFVAFAIEFVPFAIEFVPFAIEFVGLQLNSSRLQLNSSLLQLNSSLLQLKSNSYNTDRKVLADILYMADSIRATDLRTELGHTYLV